MEHRKGETSNELTSNEFPYTMEDLLQIPGIGEYTAAAIRNFAFNLPTPCIDTNIRRIFASNVRWAGERRRNVEER